MSLKTIASVLGLVLVLVLLPTTLASGEFRGTDMWSNLAPAMSGGHANDHPISYYQLDYYVDGPSVGLSGVDIGDPVAKVIQVGAAFIFFLTTLIMRATISAFDWAFNIDIINGHRGLIGPVGGATQNLYLSTFEPLMSTAGLLFGAWLVVKLLGRRFGEAGTGFVRVVLLSAAALVIVFNPGATIGRASALANEFAGGIASSSTGGNGGQDVSDRLFDTFIYRPWAVLEFGGLKRCVSSARDADGFPKVVGAYSSQRAVCRDVLHKSPSGYGGYAQRFLRYAPGSKARSREFKALEQGSIPAGNGPDGDLSGQIGISTPVDPNQFVGYHVDKADAGAVDMMQAGGAVQRIVYVFILCLGTLSAILLLGLICVVALFAQLGLLVLLGVAPVMVIAAMIPKLHEVFWAWARWIGKFLVAKVMYAIVLSAALGVSAALMVAGSFLFGYLGGVLLQSALFIGLFAFRKKIGVVATGVNRREHDRTESGARSFVTGAAAGAVAVASAPVAAAGAAATWAKSRVSKQEHASKPNSKPGGDTPKTQGSRPDATSPPASAGREYSPAPPLEAPSSEASTTVANMPETQTHERGGDPVKSFQEEYEQARSDREPVPYGEQRKTPAVDPLTHDKPPERSGATNGSFAEQLRQERANTPSQ